MSRTLLSVVMMTASMLLSAFALAAPDDPEWYLRQDSWQETVRQSREALARYLKARFRLDAAGHSAGCNVQPLAC